MRELRQHAKEFETKLIHTGQHYDQSLSEWLFHDLEMQPPDISLEVGSCSHSQQTARIIEGLENVFKIERADLVVCFGDVNSTMAAAIVAAQLGIRLAHVEAGLRSFDRSMPEEINRVVTDHLSDLLFVTEESGSRNLHSEGIPPEKVFSVGNIMIDSLIATMKIVKRSDVLDRLNLRPGKYALATLHRPSNVDDAVTLRGLLETLGEVSRRIAVVLPCHPRTRQSIARFNLEPLIAATNLTLTDPFGYIDFCRLTHDSRMVLTDSGGIQEETTYLQIPCITMRCNTERPITVTMGTNVMTGTEPEKILKAVDDILGGMAKMGAIPELWDGFTANRITDILRAV